jgi:hypothetical protein
LISARVLVAKVEVGENKIVEGNPSTPPRRRMPHSPPYERSPPPSEDRRINAP